MSDGSAEPFPVPQTGPRATNQDRDAVVERLREAVGQGALDLAELEGRLEAVYAARTVDQLAPLTADLPDTASPRRPAHQPSGLMAPFGNSAFQWHFAMWAMVNLFLVGIYVLTDPGGFFWPFFPAAGWGIGLGAHYLAARGHEQRKATRAEPRRRPGPLDAPPTPAPLRAAPGSDVQRQFVAAMFVDVVGSTELNEALGDEGWARVRDTHRTMLREVFADQRGHEVSVAGDGVLARFDHPVDAARAAIEIQRRLDGQRSRTGFAPSVRIGIHSGDVVADGDDVVGQVVNLASRVTGAADPDEIMVTEHVADHLPDSLVTADRGIHTLKGVSRPRHLLSLGWR